MAKKQTKYTPIHKLLIANRGEIASRIIRTCKRLGIDTVAIYSDADANHPFVREADEAIRIGGKQPAESYLDMDKVIQAAKSSHADAIHPGYGFLSESTAFAARCQSEGFVFVGPNKEAIDAMGSKIKAKIIMDKAGVPVIPGYNGEKQDNKTLKAEALKIGFPVLLKASAGGGGKGMRVVRKEKDLDKSIEAAKREALNGFGDDALLIEKYFDASRHIEIQIFGDKHKHYIHLGERECSIQRRHQKIIEESPSVAIDDSTRNAMGAAAVKAAEAISYDNAGTVEFIYSEDGSFYFLEVNTRLQVEHPVTEMVTGMDLVEEQIRVASGLPLSVSQDDVTFRGHAIEARLYAEDPDNDFLPVSGKVACWASPDVEDVRYDTAVRTGSEVSVFYDPMIAKIIAYGADRTTALSRLRYALRHLTVSGMTTNQAFLLKVLDNEHFISGDFNTHFVDQHMEALKTKSDETPALLAAFLADYLERDAQRKIPIPSGWRNNFYQFQQISYGIGETTYLIKYRFSVDSLEVCIEDDNYELAHWAMNDRDLSFEINGHLNHFQMAVEADKRFIHHASHGHFTVHRIPKFTSPDAAQEPGGYNAPMPGQIIQVNVKNGDAVKKGDTLLVLLSMKMENAIEAMEDGTVEEVFVEQDAFIEADTPMIKINPA